LHEAALYGQYDIAKFLLENGADVDARNPRGETPLFYAEGGLIMGPNVTTEHKRVAELLRNHGADPNSKNLFKGTTLKNANAGNYIEKAKEKL
jgi:ankyrin repeat protein